MRHTVTFLSAALFLVLSGSAAQLSSNAWDSAMIRGTTPGGKILFEPGEEMTFTLKLEGMNEPLPPNVYFVDWERRGDDGLTEKGRAPLPFPNGALTLKTRTAKPGFVCIEANVVTADGKRVPKNHRWEKRVFFQGGAGVRPDLIPMADEPDGYEAFWKSVREEAESVPMSCDLKPMPSKNPKVDVFALRLACAGGFPVTGYVTIPKAVKDGRKFPIRAAYRGASQECMPVTTSGPEDAITGIINVNGYELGRDAAYYKEFFRRIATKGYGYGMSPEQNRDRRTSYWKGVAIRAIRYLQWMKTLAGWDGKTLVLSGGSQGDWQCYHAAANVPGVTEIRANGSWGCDWTGQEQFKRLRSTYRPNCWFPDMAYFDPVFAAKRISCPVTIGFAGLGDYCSTPASLSLVFRNLRGPKKITYVQGSKHGWRPAGEQRMELQVP